MRLEHLLSRDIRSFWVKENNQEIDFTLAVNSNNTISKKDSRFKIADNRLKDCKIKNLKSEVKNQYSLVAQLVRVLH